jgi:hypothetical protein
MGFVIGMVLGLSAVVAIAALEFRNLYRAYIFSGVLWLAFLIGLVAMRAPGVAVIPILIAILMAWRFARVRSGDGLRASLAPTGDVPGLVLTLALLALFFVLGFRALRGMPEFGDGPFFSMAGTTALAYGGASFVSVLSSWRLLDLLGAIAAIATSIVGVSALGRGAAHAGGE